MSIRFRVSVLNLYPCFIFIPICVQAWCLCFDCVQDFLFFATPPLRDFWLVFALFRFARTDRPVYRPTDQRPHDRPTDRPTDRVLYSLLKVEVAFTYYCRGSPNRASRHSSHPESRYQSQSLGSPHLVAYTQTNPKKQETDPVSLRPLPSLSHTEWPARELELGAVHLVYWISGCLVIWAVGRLCVCAIEAVSHTLVLGPVVLDSDVVVLGDVDAGRLDAEGVRPGTQ